MEFDLDHIFTYHPPSPEQQQQYEAVRSAAKEFCKVVLENSPKSADQTVAVRLIREAVMVTNAAIATNGRIYKEP